MTLLDARSIAASYGPAQVLFGIDLHVASGQFVVVLGRNGAGKTTTLRVLSGLLPPTAGEIWLDGERIDGRLAEEVARMGIAHVPEGRRLFRGLTVLENLKAGAHHRRLSGAKMRERIEVSTAVFPRLVERLHQPAGTLSGGEQQMLAIARALMSAPRLLMVDEPSLGLAPLVVQELYSLFESLKKAGMTILLVEQYVDLALEVADHAYVLEKGRVAMKGPSHELARDRQLVNVYLAG